MEIVLPTYTMEKLNEFASQQWGKARSFLRKTYSLTEDESKDVFQEAFITLFTQIKNGSFVEREAKMSQEILEKIANIMAQDDMEGLFAECKSIEEVTAVLNEHGADVTPEDVQMFIDHVYQANGEELSEEDLETVSGGGRLWEKVKKIVVIIHEILSKLPKPGIKPIKF